MNLSRIEWVAVMDEAIKEKEKADEGKLEGWGMTRGPALPKGEWPFMGYLCHRVDQYDQIILKRGHGYPKMIYTASEQRRCGTWP